MSHPPRIMAPRFFVYYCALSGGWSAFVGFLLGIAIAPQNPVGQAGILGMFVGLLLASSLGCLDGVWAGKRSALVVLQGLAAAPVGALAGLVGGIVGHLLSELAEPLRLLAWAIMGAMIGVSISVFDFVDAAIRQVELRSARSRLMKRLLSGLTGGFVGGLFALLLSLVFTRALRDRDPNWLWSPRALAFVALGMCISLAVGVLRVLMKDE